MQCGNCCDEESGGCMETFRRVPGPAWWGCQGKLYEGSGIKHRTRLALLWKR